MRTLLRGFGEICLSAGLIILWFVAYLLWGTSIHAASVQQQFAHRLDTQWNSLPPRPKPSASPSPAPASPIHPVPERLHLALAQPFGFIRIPALGRSWKFAIVEGTGLPELALGPGHVQGTQLPGQLGNFAVAAHRVTAGNPFWNEPHLRAGDLVYIDTRLNTYTYRITGKQWVLPTDVGVLDAVPGHPWQHPHSRLITLITCDPAWTGTYRVIVTGVLVAAQPRAA